MMSAKKNPPEKLIVSGTKSPSGIPPPAHPGVFIQKRRLMQNPFIAAECRRNGVGQNKIPTMTPESYSQAGEDVVVEALILAMASKAPAAKGISYFEIGANHPIQTSNTYLLNRKLGASGVLVEADPDLIPVLRQVRGRDQVVHAAVSDRRDPTALLHVAQAKELSSIDFRHLQGFAHFGDNARATGQIEVPNLHVNDLMAQYATFPIHYLSIDVEGLDLPILRAMDFEHYRPWILSCEPSPHVYRSNPQEMFDVMSRNGYALIGRTSVNMIFVDRRWL